MAKSAVRVIRLFNKQMSDLADFFIAAGESDGVAPATGSHSLSSYYEELAPKLVKEKPRGR